VSIAESIVNDIVKDISGRCGIGNEFEQIDADIQAEMVGDWQAIVTKHLKAITKDATESEIAQKILQDCVPLGNS
jgi:hypothetical protein